MDDSVSDVPEVVVDARQFAEVVASAACASVLAFDLEFVAGKHFASQLCLLQLGYHDQAGQLQIALVDPLALDVRPALELLADGKRVVVAHAARQDVGLLASEFDLEVRSLFDTQLAASLLGMGDQLGFGPLVAARTGVALDKGSQFTDWARRPLSDKQLRYAADDVRYLPGLYASLSAELSARGRLGWLLEESAAVVAEGRSAAKLTRDDAWRQLGSVRGLDPQGMAALVALAAWRYDVAMRVDRPVPHVLADKLLVELARARPRNERAFRELRGMSPGVREHAAELLTVIGNATVDNTTPTAQAALAPAGPRVALWTELILALVSEVAAREEVPSRLLAARASAESLARSIDRGGVDAASEHPLMQTWRRELIGTKLDGFFRGKVALACDTELASGIRIA